MKWGPKIGVAVALAAGLVAAVYLVWSIGFDPVFAAIARAGFGGLALLCLYALAGFRQPGFRLAFPAAAARAPAVARILSGPAGARLHRRDFALLASGRHGGGGAAVILKGMSGAYAARVRRRRRHHRSDGAGGVPGFWPGLGVSQFRHLVSARCDDRGMLAVLLLAVPGIALLIFLQKKGATFAERMAARFFPQGGKASRFHAAIEELYDSHAAWRHPRLSICWPGSARASAPGFPSAWSGGDHSC